MIRSSSDPAQEIMSTGLEQLRLPALEIMQSPSRRLYTFGIDGKLIPEIATVSRVRRDDHSTLHGYQRPENLTHVAAIRRYIDTDENPLLPNAIVIAFDQRVRFESMDQDADQMKGYACPGHLIIPIDRTLDDADKPGFIVDGQQRCAAIRDAHADSFRVAVSAFITEELGDQRSQFILVNSTKALPKGLIHELLPATTGTLPVPLVMRQVPATMLERLNFDTDSPLHGRIRTPTNPRGVIKDNSVLRMLENSLTDGVLYRYRGQHDLPNIGEMTTLVANYWAAVAEVFSEAWYGKSPRNSRLLHGAGIIAMGFLMDEITRGLPDGIPSTEDFTAELKTIKDHCAWTYGAWHFSDDNVRQWNDIQNTPRDVRCLTDFVLNHYRQVDNNQRIDPGT